MTPTNLSVATRLTLAFGLLLALLATTAGVGLFNSSRLNDGVTEIVDGKVPKMVASADLSVNLLINWHAMRDVIASADAKTTERELGVLQAMREKRRMLIANLELSISKPKGIAALKAIDAARRPFEAMDAEFAKLAAAGNQDAARAVMARMLPAHFALLGAANKLSEVNQEAIAISASQARDTYAFTRNCTLALLAVSLLVGLLAALGVSRSLLRQLGGEPAAAAALARAVSAGDLRTAVTLRGGDTDSLMAQMVAMQAQLAVVVQSVRTGAGHVATASAEISSGNNDLSARTEQQASALEQTAASMEELGSTVRHNADNAAQANQLAVTASSVAVRGGDVVGQVVETMKGINDSSRRIADIIGVIDGIAFQTNILALNAAVEAARAGEQGRGFAVVASEVRSLAQRSAGAAKEIKSLISASVERVAQGTTLVDQAGVTMAEVVGSIKRVTDIMAEISAASEEQRTGVMQVGEAVTQMDRTTQQNAALVEQSAAAAESLKGQAAQLVQTVAVFKLAGQLP